MPQCCACDQEQLRSAFSKMQLRKSADKRKCGMCVAAILAIQCHPCDDSQPKETLDDKESLDEMPGESIMRWMDPPPFAACEHGTKGMTPLTIARCRKRCEDIAGLVWRLNNPQSYSRPRSMAAFQARHKGVDESLRVMYANGALAVLGGDLQLARVVAAITCFAEIFLSTGASGAIGRSEIAFKNHLEIFKLVMSTIESDDAMVRRIANTIPCNCLDDGVKQIVEPHTPTCDNCSLGDSTLQYWDCICGLATYCSKACQNKAWPKHKNQCKQVTAKFISNDGGKK